MANVFRQFLIDAENGDVNAVRRNIDNGIDLETRDEVRPRWKLPKRLHVCVCLRSGSANSIDLSGAMQSLRVREGSSRRWSRRQR